MAQTRRTAQRAEIVTSGLDSGQDIVSGPATRWMPGDNIDFPIERLAGSDAGQAGGHLVTWMLRAGLDRVEDGRWRINAKPIVWRVCLDCVL